MSHLGQQDLDDFLLLPLVKAETLQLVWYKLGFLKKSRARKFDKYWIAI